MSQFASLFKTDDKAKTEKKSESLTAKKKAVTSPPSPARKTQPAKPEKRGSGKSSNSAYTQVLTYLKKDTHNRAKARLIFDSEKRDLSDLVEELLADWLNEKK